MPMLSDRLPFRRPTIGLGAGVSVGPRRLPGPETDARGGAVDLWHPARQLFGVEEPPAAEIADSDTIRLFIRLTGR